MYSYQQSSDQRGFTLIELMVSIAIVTLVMGVVLFKYNTLNDVVLLKSQAYAIALDIRQAQVSGVSAQDTNMTPSASFTDNTFGIQFQKGSQDYFLYENSPSNIIASSTIDSRFQILAICDNGYNSAPYNNCQSTSANITFKRPDFTANISDSKHGSGRTSLSLVISPTNDTSMTRTVMVTQTGQIAVQ